MRFKSLPGIIALISGLIVGVLMLIYNAPVDVFLFRLFLVLLLAYVGGLIIRFVMLKLIDITMDKEPEEEKSEEQESDETPKE